MEINRENFLKALETVKPGLASKEAIDQSTHFAFSNNRVMTFNDEISVSCPVEGGLEGAVSANELYELVRKYKTEKISVEISENELLISSGRAKAGLVFQSEILLPVNEIGKMGKWKKLPDDFSAGIAFVMGSCGKNSAKPILTCVHIKGDLLEGSDGFRIANYRTAEQVPVDALIPANNCLKIVKLVPDEIASGDGWVHFKKNDVILSCRVFEEKYVDTQKFMGSVKGIKLTFPSNLIQVMEKAGVFSKRETILDEVMTISINNNSLLLKSESDSGWYKEKMKINYDGEPVEFQFTPYLLKDILNQTSSAVLSKNKLVFESENWKYLTLLL